MTLGGAVFVFFRERQSDFPPANNPPSIVKIQTDILKLRGELNGLYEKNNANGVKIENLSRELEKLKNQNPVKNINNIKILATTFSIIERINNNEDFSEEYSLLRILTEEKSAIRSQTLKMENYLGCYGENIKNLYAEEYNRFSKGEANTAAAGIIKRFLGAVVIVRKINNIDRENGNKTDAALYDLSRSIENRNYAAALDIIENNQWADSFPATRAALIRRIELKTLTGDILRSIYEEY